MLAAGNAGGIIQLVKQILVEPMDETLYMRRKWSVLGKFGDL
jgi:hypothetical protein